LLGQTVEDQIEIQFSGYSDVKEGHGIGR